MTEFQGLIKEICKEKNIDFKLLSKDWIMKLERDNKVRYIVGTKFPLNNQASAIICNDKYATYQVLKNKNIPMIEHQLIYRKDFTAKYESDLKNRKEIKEYLKKYQTLVIKDTCGSQGKQVFKVDTFSQIKKAFREIFSSKNTAVINPFMKIESEYRIICLAGNAEVIFEKVRQGNTWKHNLCKGAIARLVVEEEERTKLITLALEVTNALDIEFASVDLIKVDGKLYVLEVNSGVCMNKFMKQVENGREIAKRIYAKAIEKMIS